MNQQDHDERSLAWHRLVIKRMQSDPGLIDKARMTLDLWLSKGPQPNRVYLAEWQRAMDAGLDALEQLATTEGDHPNALRQCSPISGVLTNEERWAFRREWSRSCELKTLNT